MNKYNKPKYSIPLTRKYKYARNLSLDQPNQSPEDGAMPNFAQTMMLNHGSKSEEKRNRGRLKGVKAVFNGMGEGDGLEGQHCFQENVIENQLINVNLPKPKFNIGSVGQTNRSQAMKTRKLFNFQKTKESLTKKPSKGSIQKVESLSQTKRHSYTIAKRVQTEKQQSQRSQAQPQSQAEKLHSMRMKELHSYFDQDKLFNRLSIYSKETLKSSLRVYREDFQKIITQRYGKDRVTTFLDTEYIEDYASMRKNIQEICKYTADEVQALIFIIMDQNADGLITPGDLITFIGATNEKAITNPLLMEDLYEIMRYLNEKYCKKGDIMDLPSYQYQILTQESLTIMKWRIYKFEKFKKANDQEGRSRRSKLLTSHVKERLFTLREEKYEKTPGYLNKRVINNIGSVISYMLNRKKRFPNPNTEPEKVPTQFAINFQSFKQIFNEKIPRTFIDFLFLIGGIEVPKTMYIPIDSSVLIKNVAVKVEVEEERGLDKIRGLLRGMKELSQESTYVYHTLTNESP